MSPPPTHDPTTYLATALQIGRRIASQGQWQGDLCSWHVMVPDPSGQSRASVAQPASGLLYQGTAGIARFLGQLAAASDDDALRHSAAGALRHALASAQPPPGNDSGQPGGTGQHGGFGLHSGRLGIAWVAAHLAELLDQPDWRQDAWELLEPLFGHASQDHSLDVIGGAAGAIPALLDLCPLWRQDERREQIMGLARDLGEHLLSKAHREPEGWSWPTLPRASYRNLAGLAHGTSGIGLALLELAKASGDGRYRFAAEMAFLYERSCYDAERQNWPDWRNMPLSEIYQFGRLDLLRQLLREGRVPAYQKHFMTAWCHGSPGVGLARLRAWELSGQDLYLQEARLAMQSTALSLTAEALGHSNFSLCHGALGNCELLLHGAHLLQDDDLLATCRRVADLGIEAWEGQQRPWPSGTLDGQSDASLLLGEAGVGSFYLRLAVPSVSSPLLLRPPHDAGASLPEDGYSDLAASSVDTFFRHSRRRWQHLSGGAFQLPTVPPGDQPLAVAPSGRAYDAFMAFLDDGVEAHQRPLFEDAWAIERAAYEAQRAIEDFTQESLRALVRPDWQDLSLDGCTFHLAADARLVTTQHAWPSSAPQDSAERQDSAEKQNIEDGAALPEAEETTVLLLRQQQRFEARPLGRFAAAILGELSDGVQLTDLVATIAEAVGAEDPSSVAPTVLQQLAQLYAVGFIDAVVPRNEAPWGEGPRSESSP